MNEKMLHYNIIRLLGEGGMGAVYLANDTRLDRPVALKVMGGGLHQDDQELGRFKTEAKAAAALNHANIATIYAVEEMEDNLFITMEYVEGNTLRAHMPKSGMPLKQFFDYFLPLTDGLHHAHEHHRIHRDLKPGNIMITSNGVPKILDFGLARIMPEGTGPPDSEAPTQSVAVRTATGVVMGTPAYMSPEQAQGKPVDHRSDIFSIGVVMYEALTGSKPFAGENVAAMLGNLLKDEPESITTHRIDVPYHLWRIIKKCLQKDVRQRYQSTLDVHNDLLELKQDLDNGTINPEATDAIAAFQHTTDGSLLRHPYLRRTGIFICFLIAFGLGWELTRWDKTPTPPVRKYTVPINGLLSEDDRTIISPDGVRIAYTHRGRLWVRDLDTIEPREIQGTEGAKWPFWSPDGKYIAYILFGNPSLLKKVPAEGGPSITICETKGIGHQGAWSTEGVIMLAADMGSGAYELVTVSEQGGPISSYWKPDEELKERHFGYPYFSPDGKSVLYNIYTYEGKMKLAAQSGEERNFLMEGKASTGIFQPLYAPSGHLVYGHGSSRKTSIWAVPFSWEELTVTGDRTLLVSEGFRPSISQDGILVYKSKMLPLHQLTWVNRNGKIEGDFGEPQAAIFEVSLAPDDQQAVAIGFGSGNNVWNLYLYDGSGTRNKLTFDARRDRSPSWSPTGDRIAFSKMTSASNSDIVIMSPDGTQEPRPFLFGSQHMDRPCWSPDGRYLIFQMNDSDNQNDLWYVDVSNPQQRIPFVKSPFDDVTPVFSPDGGYVAYVSDTSGRYEVYVRTFPTGDGRRQVSQNGGVHPRWNGLGDELFYVEENTLMAVPLDRSVNLRPGAANPLFGGDQLDNILYQPITSNAYGTMYDVTSDGQRFLVIRPIEEKRMGITVVENWPSLLEGD